MSLIFVLAVCSFAFADIADFDNLYLEPESYWNGADDSGGFTSGSVYFDNYYDETFGNWAGFAYSNITDTTLSGWSAQYNAIAGSGQGGSANYGIGYMDSYNTIFPTLHPDQTLTIDYIYVTNTNYAYYSMQDGDAFAKKFGGSTGDDPDWFLLTITGIDQGGGITGTVDFYLADFRFENNDLDYILNTWQPVDISALGIVESLQFSLTSSDTGDWGMNTPAYFALDTIVPEPATVILLGFGVLLIGKRKTKADSNFR
ncbi:MAG: DUF4465 domain-containing protein [Sedimentisphaerales bacterium]|nr:DUF4465 domain-containing protein [Sedimentisphaerales bacterium]